MWTWPNHSTCSLQSLCKLRTSCIILMTAIRENRGGSYSFLGAVTVLALSTQIKCYLLTDFISEENIPLNTLNYVLGG